ncbi:MAG: NUDIX domain-containing protein [Anaerolineae bacterium]|nr:NUDIX domain-containing protein [Anaerolineae bacterium]
MVNLNTQRPFVGVGIFVERDDEILLVKRRGPHGANTWSTPGGLLEFGEAPETCAVREVYEETGVHVGDVRFVGLTNNVFESENVHSITIWMRGRYLSGDACAHAPEEILEAGWFAWGAFPAPHFLPLAHWLAGRRYVSPTHGEEREGE